jgi:hypothetical protein
VLLRRSLFGWIVDVLVAVQHHLRPGRVERVPDRHIEPHERAMAGR